MKTKQIVEGILTEQPETRGNDLMLIVAYCQKTGKSTDLRDWVYDGKNILESITRARRKVQETNPLLKPSEEVQRKRAKLESEVRAWARETI